MSAECRRAKLKLYTARIISLMAGDANVPCRLPCLVFQLN